MKKYTLFALAALACVSAIAATPRSASASVIAAASMAQACGNCDGAYYLTYRCSGGQCGCSLFCPKT